MKLFICLLPLFITVASYAQPDKEKMISEITAMAKVAWCYDPTFSADGKEISFLSNMSGSPQVWKMSATGGWPVQLTGFGDPVVTQSWSPKGDWIAFELAPGGGLNQQIYLMRPDGMDTKMITAGGKVNNSMGRWSHDGKYLSFTSNEQNPAGLDCFVYDLEKNKSSLVAKNNGTGSINDFSYDNSEVLINRLVSRGSNDLFLVPIAGGKEKLLTKHEGPGSFFGAFGNDKNIYVGSNKDRDLVAFGYIGRKGEIEILAERKNAELNDIVISHTGAVTVLSWSEAGRNKFSLFDHMSRTESKLPDFPVELVSGISFSPDDSQLLFIGSGSTEPVNLWLLNLKNGQFNKLTESPHPGVDLKSLVVPELVTFKSFDGLELSGWLYKPAGKAPYPTVISFHGGPEGQSIPSFNSTAQALVKHGMAVLLPNVRGSSGFGKKFVNLDNGALRANGVKDIQACYDYLIHSGIAVKGRIGIMGGSYGGYMVMAGVTEYPDLFAAGANLYGVVNFITFFEKTEAWMAAISKVEYGDPATQSDMLRKLSPINKVSVVKTPLIVLHGANDTNVPVVEAEQVVDALKKNNVPVKYILFPDEGHGWRKLNNRVTSIVEIVDWFDRYLK